MSSEPFVIAIPTWQRPEPLRQNLEGLCAQRMLPTEVIVIGRPVDTQARNVVREIAATAPFPIRWLDVDRPGHIAPILVAREAVTEGFIGILDDDLVTDSGWIESARAVLADEQVACVGGRILQPPTGWHGVPWDDAGCVRWYGRQAANVTSLETDGPITVDTVPEGNCAWRAEVFRRVAFDPFLDFDDSAMYGLDLTWQAQELGWHIKYDSAIRAEEIPAERDPSLDRRDRAPRLFCYCRNFTYVTLRHRRGWKRAAFYVWWWGIGERGSYGLSKAAVDLFRGPDRGKVWRESRASFAGRYAGWRHYLGTKRS